MLRRDVTHSSVYLYGSADDARAGVMPGGAGCLIGLPHSGEPGSYLLYALTCSRVIKDGAGVLRVERSNGRPALILQTEKKQWVRDPAGGDAAVFPLDVPPGAGAPDFFPVDSLPAPSELEESGVGIGDKVIFTGWIFDGDGRQLHVPTARHGRLTAIGSSAWRLRADEEPDVLLADAPAGFAYSGTPVFLAPTAAAPVWLLGINQGNCASTYPVLDRAGEAHREGWRVSSDRGQAIVLPSWSLKALLDADRLAAAREVPGRPHRRPVSAPGANRPDILTKERFLAKLEWACEPAICERKGESGRR